MKDVIYFGELNNWMDFRDTLIEELKECNNEYMFNKLMFAISQCMSTSVEEVERKRKELGIKPLSTEQKENLKKEMGK